MRVTFPRLPDHERAWALVERDDGVVYRLYGGTAGPRLPHDITHLVAERELRIKDGIWAGIAGGAASTASSTSAAAAAARPSARKTPAALRSRATRAELLADLGPAPRRWTTMALEKIRRLAVVKLAVLPSTDVDPVVIAAAARALPVEAARWARLRVGEELSYDWPRK